MPSRGLFTQKEGPRWLPVVKDSRQRTPGTHWRLLRPRSSDPRTSATRLRRPAPRPQPGSRPGPAALRRRGAPAVQVKWVPGARARDSAAPSPGWVSVQTSPRNSRYSKYSQNSRGQSGSSSPNKLDVARFALSSVLHGPVITHLFSSTK